MENYKGFNAIKIYWFDTEDNMVFRAKGIDYQTERVCFETIPLSEVADDELPKIMEMYYPRNLKIPKIVRPIKIDFVNLKREQK
jgi:hypothetical protein